jgi:hypothetical protein
MKNHLSRATTLASALVAALAVTAQAALAASPLAAIPVGQSANYHLTSTTNSPDKGAQSSSHYILIKRTAMTSFAVAVDGAPAGVIEVSPDGGAVVPPQLTSAMAPFGQVTLLMKGAPEPLAAGSNWVAALPVPLDGDTDNVATMMAVQQFGPGGATIAATGHESTTVKPMLRTKPTDITISASMNYNAARMLTYASSNVAIVIHTGKLRSKHAGSTWTLSLVPAP